MSSQSFNPLNEYKSVYAPRFKQIAETTFNELDVEAQVEKEANRSTCKEIYALEEDVSTAKKQIGWWTFGCVILWILAVLCIWMVIFPAKSNDNLYIITRIVPAIFAVLFLFIKVHPTIKRLKGLRNDLNSTLDDLKNKAFKQMESLNRLFRWDMFSRMMSSTMPQISFDPYCSAERIEDFVNNFGLEYDSSPNTSVLYTHSGTINGNPFILYRTKEMKMINKKYEGSKRVDVIDYTYRDKYGTHSSTSKERVWATYYAPCPTYQETTRLVYGCSAIPELNFKRESTTRKGNRLQRAKFDKLFKLSECNNPELFSMMFAPIVQDRFLDLLKDIEVGYGDYFNFEKKGKISTIIPNHLQKLCLDMNPQQFHGFDFEKVRNNFIEANINYFKAVYFAFAPVLAISEYQKIRPDADVEHSTYSYFELESLANLLSENFKHDECKTECIIKTEYQHDSTVLLSAHGYKIEQKWATAIGSTKKQAFDVQVKYDNYVPVVGYSKIQLHSGSSMYRDQIAFQFIEDK